MARQECSGGFPNEERTNTEGTKVVQWARAGLMLYITSGAVLSGKKLGTRL